MKKEGGRQELKSPRKADWFRGRQRAEGASMRDTLLDVNPTLLGHGTEVARPIKCRGERASTTSANPRIRPANGPGRTSS